MMAPDKVRQSIRIKAAQEAKKRDAKIGKDSAFRRVEEEKKRIAAIQERVLVLESLEEGQKTAELKEQIEKLEKERIEKAAAIKAAEEDGERYSQALVDAEMLDVEDEVDKTQTPYDVNRDLAALLAGTAIDDREEYLALDEGSGLRETQTVVGYKGGFGKTAYIRDVEIPRWPIHRLRIDLVIDEMKVPNIMDRRRADMRKIGSKEVWGIKDVYGVKGIAIAVPDRYSGVPEDLIAKIPYMSKEKKDQLRKDDQPIPRQPDMQLLI